MIEVTNTQIYAELKDFRKETIQFQEETNKRFAKDDVFHAKMQMRMETVEDIAECNKKEITGNGDVGIKEMLRQILAWMKAKDEAEQEKKKDVKWFLETFVKPAVIPLITSGGVGAALFAAFRAYVQSLP